MISTIAKASNEQAEGIDNVSQAISEMDTTTQQNAGLVEEAAPVVRTCCNNLPTCSV